jgi:hypothetical protein
MKIIDYCNKIEISNFYLNLVNKSIYCNHNLILLMFINQQLVPIQQHLVFAIRVVLALTQIIIFTLLITAKIKFINLELV